MTIITFTPTQLGLVSPVGSGSYPAGTIVGGESALEVADEGASYVEVAPAQGVSFVPVPDKPCPPVEKVIRVWWAAQFRLLDVTGEWYDPDYALLFEGENIDGFYSEPYGVPPTHSLDWVTVAVTPYHRDAPGALIWLTRLYEAWAFDSTLVSAVCADAGPVQVSWLRLYAEVEGDIPLRIRQRGDGLGMGGPRVRGVGSRQRSPRVRGYV